MNWGSGIGGDGWFTPVKAAEVGLLYTTDRYPTDKKIIYNIKPK